MADDPTKDGTDAKIVSFRPRSDSSVSPPPLPPLPPAPKPSVLADAPARDTSVPAAFLSEGLPRAGTMGPPLALMMPPPPALPDAKTGDDPGGDEDGEGEFAPLAPADPDNPTAQEILQTCMTLVTALGVAAAKGMWHRARHRQALADQARADADKAKAKAAANGHHGGHGGGHGGSRGAAGKGGGLLTGSRQEGTHRKHRGGHGPGGGPGGGRKDPHGGDRKSRPHSKGPGGPHGDSHKAPKTKNGKHRGGADTGGLGTKSCIKNRKPRKAIDDKTTKDGKAPKATKDGKKQHDKDTPKPKGPAPLKWKAPRKSRPGPGGDKALPPGRKRWARPPAGSGAGKQDGKTTKTTKGGTKRTRRTWKATTRWLKRWRTRHAAATAAPGATTTGATGTSGAGGGQQAGRARRESWKRPTPPPPPPRGAEWMRPPPGADRSPRITVERVDTQPRPRRRSALAPVAGAPAAGRPALALAAAASSTTTPTTATTSDESPTVQAAASQATGGQMNRPAIPARAVPAPRPAAVAAAVAAMPTHGVQYDDDAELTIRDVIEAAEDAAEEITEGVDAARATAIGAERMAGRLDALHAEIVELKVPGWLAAIWVRLVDKALHVKACAEGLAEALPAASEAIATAAGNAAARHVIVADTTRDYGHIRPAEREYHDE
ncbi:hypothetical protein [Nonomuraea sp. B19D2]|uniref:hypothetical protein n=1 Tax=Nonomuraea sp. B19D2 TaxID=3159561 RepID=UPI0032DA30CA